MSDEEKTNTEEELGIDDEPETVEPELEPEPESDPRDARIKTLEESNLRYQRDMEELRMRVDEAEEIMANPDKYAATRELEPAPRMVDYSELDPNQLAATLKTEISREVARIIEEKQKPILTQQQEQRRQKEQEELQTLQNKLTVQVNACKKLEDWNKYEGEIYRKTDEYVRKHGMKALVDSEFVESQYAKMRLNDAKERIAKRKKTGSTVEKPSTSASGAEERMTMEKAFDKAWDELPEENRALLE